MARRLRCMSCMRRYRAQDLKTLESTARYGVFRLRCPICSAQRVIVAVWNKSALRTYATDLDAQEWDYYRRTPPIDYNDVIRVARMLREYNGDFSDVLEDPLFEDSPFPK